VVEKMDIHQELMLRLTTRLVLLALEHSKSTASDPVALITNTYRALQMAGTVTADVAGLKVAKGKLPPKRKKSSAVSEATGLGHLKSRV
jgi:hypothetical protein